MAGDWIKMRTDLAEDPAVIAMAATLDVDEDLIVGKLHRLWSWADRQSRDGHASGVTEKWIDRFIRHAGFASALAGVGWLLIDETGIHFPNFDRHNGETSKIRALGAKRKQKERSESHANVPDVSRNERDKSVTREEKRREEKEAEDRPASPASSVPDCPHAEIVALFHEVLPACSRVKVWDEQRQTLLRKRWREDPKRQSLDYWRRMFVHCSKSDFLMGRTAGRDGRTFGLTLDWLIRPSNFAKIIEGKYHDVR